MKPLQHIIKCAEKVIGCKLLSLAEDGHIALANKQKSLILIKFNNGKKCKITSFITDQKRTFLFCICVNMILAPLNKLKKKRRTRIEVFLKRNQASTEVITALRV